MSGDNDLIPRGADGISVKRRRLKDCSTFLAVGVADKYLLYAGGFNVRHKPVVVNFHTCTEFGIKIAYHAFEGCHRLRSTYFTTHYAVYPFSSGGQHYRGFGIGEPVRFYGRVGVAALYGSA